MAVVKALAITSLPFVLAEVATGFISFFTGALRIPPIVDIGTAVDLAILFLGCAVAVFWTRKKNLPAPGGGEDRGR